MPLTFTTTTSGLRVYDGKQLLAEVPTGTRPADVRRFVKDQSDIARVASALSRLRNFLEKAADGRGVLRR